MPSSTDRTRRLSTSRYVATLMKSCSRCRIGGLLSPRMSSTRSSIPCTGSKAASRWRHATIWVSGSISLSGSWRATEEPLVSLRQKRQAPRSRCTCQSEGPRVFQTTLRASFAAQSGPSGQEVCCEEAALFRRANHRSLAAGRRRGPGRRRLPPVGISEQTFYRWKKVYGGMPPSEARELKQLRDENLKLKRLAADLSLDKVCLLYTSDAADDLLCVDLGGR